MKNLEELKRLDVIDVNDFGKMQYRGTINQKGDMVFLGRGLGKESKSIVTLTINKSNVSINKEEVLIFQNPYQQDKTFKYFNRLNKGMLQVHNYTQLDIYLNSIGI